MDKYEAAIAEIKGCTEYNFKTKISVGTCETVMQACRKQIAMKVDYSEKNYSNLPVSKCPNCGSVSINAYVTINNCPNCGQKLDWSDENE